MKVTVTLYLRLIDLFTRGNTLLYDGEEPVERLAVKKCFHGSICIRVHYAYSCCIERFSRNSEANSAIRVVKLVEAVC